MKIIVNGDLVESDAPTLADLLDALGKTHAAVATAMNADFVPSALRASTVLRDGDRIEIVAPRQGG